MSLTRREALATIGATALVAGCAKLPQRLSLDAQSQPEVALTDRFGFGPSWATQSDVRSKGSDRWFSDQLHAPIDEPTNLSMKLWSLPITHLSPWDLRDWQEQDVLRQLQMAAIWRAVESPWQVRERLVHFWTDHFNIFGRKGLAAFRKHQDEVSVVRSNALRSFPDLLRASSKSTAMLNYLDQQASDLNHPNENYARELLELHTLGVDGGYSQRDVMEVARCFTGWTEERGFLKRKGSFKFDASMHDNGEKVVLGHKIPPGGGQADGEAVLDLVANHPATARHVSQKLCRWYVSEPSQKLKRKVERSFISTSGDIPSMMTTIYDSGEWRDGGPIIKRPIDFLVSALRAIGADTNADKPLQEHLAAMGQPLYQWPMPDGYPVRTEAWAGSMLARWNFAFALCHGDIKGTTFDVNSHLNLVPQGLRATKDDLALWLCHPDFQWR